MARARNIKPGFFTNDVLGELDPLARLLFAGLWTLCDRDGRVEDRPKKIKVETVPYDDCDPDELLEALRAGGFIERYEVDGRRIIQVVAWSKHQTPHMKEAASTLPAPVKHSADPVQAPDGVLPDPAPAHLIPDSGYLIPDSSTEEEAQEAQLQRSSQAGLMCKAMRTQGVQDVNPGHPDLIALIDAGATVAEFEGAAAEAYRRGKGFAYSLTVLTNQRIEAARKSTLMHKGEMPARAPPESFREREVAAKAARVREMTGGLLGNGSRTKDKENSDASFPALG
jgi:hypothetical protein